MCYLDIILKVAMKTDGSFKATITGNLPAKLVKQASEHLDKLVVTRYDRVISISEFAGSNESKFNALHYTRLLTDISGIIYRRSGRIHVKKVMQG